MISSEWTHTSAASTNSNNWSRRTDQSNSMLNEIYQAMEWFNFADYAMISSL